MLKSLIFIFTSFISNILFSQEIKLLPPDTTGGKALMSYLQNRKSTRIFDKTISLTDNQLLNLIWAANGLNRHADNKRTAPSSRNYQEIELYISLKSSIYKYNHLYHKLELIKAGNYIAEMGKQKFVENASVVIIFVANYNKMSNSTQEQKTFYSAVDAGFISQNIYLYCASKGLNTVVLGYIDKEKISEILNLNKEEQKVVLTQPVGFGG